MTDWTTPEDVPTTTVDRLHRWLLQEGNPEDAATPGERAVADIIRTFWPVPAATLSKELAHITEVWETWTTDTITEALTAATDRAKQVENDRDEARSEVERLTARNAWPKTTPSGHTYNKPTKYGELRRQCANAGQAASEGWDDAERPPHPTWEMVGIATAEVERLTAERLDRNPETKARVEAALNNLDKAETVPVQKGAESNAETPNPADVKPGEAWVVECRGERRTAVKDRDDDEPWNTVAAYGLFFSEENEDVTLVTRLVPAPRVITNPDELDRAKRCTIILDSVGVVCERASLGDGWFTTQHGTDQTPYIQFPATVLWEPGA